MIAGHVFLVGMAGSGKSRLGSRAALALNMPLVDVDQRIGQMFGISVDQLQRSLGEALYHNAEAGVLMELVDAPPAVVVTGEDLPLQKENVQLMLNHGTIVHVDRPPEQVISKQKPGDDVTDTLEYLQHYKRNIGFYRACADHVLENTGSMEQGVQRLLSFILSGR